MVEVTKVIQVDNFICDLPRLPKPKIIEENYLTSHFDLHQSAKLSRKQKLYISIRMGEGRNITFDLQV